MEVINWNYVVFFQGKIRNLPESKVALSTCDGIHGIIHIGNETYSIHPKNDAQLDGHHMIFNQKSIEQNTSQHVPREILFRENQMQDIQRRVISGITNRNHDRIVLTFIVFSWIQDEEISKE